MYDYVRHTYGVEPQVGQPVRLKGYPPGKVAPEDANQSHYVMVRFEGWDHDAPAHPTDLEYLPRPGEERAAPVTGLEEDHTLGNRSWGRGGSRESFPTTEGAEGRNWID
jgi:hypothetical protein